MNNLKTKVNDLDDGKLKTVPVDLKKLSHLVENEVVKKNPDVVTLININQFNTDNQNLVKKNWGCWWKNTRYEWFSDCISFKYKS